jgi:alkylhydroperoxidase/carboxymuconolactone decarboxylase family protein YurZ
MTKDTKAEILAARRAEGRALYERLVGKPRSDADGPMRLCSDGSDEFCWGAVWSRPAVTDKTRAGLALAMCAAQTQIEGVKECTRIALRTGWSVAEIAEILFHVQCYAGVYPSLDSTKAASEVIAEVAPRETRQPAADARVDHEGLPGPDDDVRSMNELGRAGLRIRREVLGANDIDRWMAETIKDPFIMMFFDLTHEYCFGTVWARPVLEYRMRSMLCLTINACRGLSGAVRRHIRSAVGVGMTKEDIGELFLLVYAYAGVYCSLNGFMTAKEVFADLAREGIPVREKRRPDDPPL